MGSAVRMLVAAAGAPMGAARRKPMWGGADVGALGLPGLRPVAAAVILGTEERAPLDHMLGYARITGIARGCSAVDHRIVASGEGPVAHGIPILGPFPDVAGHH